MRHVKQSGNRRFNLWWLLPLVLLALPNCGLNAEGCMPAEEFCPVQEEETCPDPENPECPEPDPVPEFEAGTDPADAVLCDIVKPPNEEDEDPCATLSETNDPNNISLSEAATALVNGDSKSFALDFSDPIACPGRAKKIKYFGDFPDGLRVCINCSEKMPNPYPTLVKVCIAQCKDLINLGSAPIPPEGTDAYCEANAKVATNHQPDICYQGACNGGNPNLNWVDPRKTPEPVTWVDHIGTDIDAGSLNDLKRTAATTGPDTVDFNAGAASAQIITTGDAWVEFSALNATDKAHVLGVRESVDSVGDPCFDASLCADDDPSLNAIGFAIALNTTGEVFVFEVINGALTGQGPFPAYSPGERFRVNVTDRHDGTATITYSRKVGSVFTQFAETTQAHPQYPLRVDTSFREEGAIIENATIVRIK